MENLLLNSSGLVVPRFIPLFAATQKKSTRSLAPSSSKSRNARESNSANRVLLFGSIRELALYRAEVLSNRGFTVVTPRNKQEAKDAIRNGQFDIAVLTYTLSSDTVQELAQLLREYCPTCPLVAITASGKDDPVIQPDATVIADEGPVALVAALRRLLRRQ
jgi:DNA-binding response OmpR family regulator